MLLLLLLSLSLLLLILSSSFISPTLSRPSCTYPLGFPVLPHCFHDADSNPHNFLHSASRSSRFVSKTLYRSAPMSTCNAAATSPTSLLPKLVFIGVFTHSKAPPLAIFVFLGPHFPLSKRNSASDTISGPNYRCHRSFLSFPREITFIRCFLKLLFLSLSLRCEDAKI